MNGLIMMLAAVAVLGAGYFFYGRWLAKTWGVDPKAATPAYELRVGVDYEPADTPVVFGHQFASIAGAGPINGPIQAAVFGWVPVFLWILVGGVFFGAVQDFSAMYASVKNKGRTIGYIIEEYIGKLGKKLFLLFCWLFCILVVAAFSDIVAETFNGFTADGERIAANGSVAATSMLFIIEAVGLGLLLRFSRLNKCVNTLIAVALLAAGVAAGLAFPLYVASETWHIIIFIYIMIASVVPVWALLQPRDYLNSYLLIFMILGSVVGILFTNPAINLPAFTSFAVEGTGNMFPILFVTIACGAVSGFHSLVSSGTASKQIKNEKHMLPVSFGAMLLESLLAVIALIAAASFASGEAAAAGYSTPAQLFAGGVANFLTTLGLPHGVVFKLVNLAVSAFALTSLDSVARVGRLSFQELFLDVSVNDDKMEPWRRVLTNKYFATALTLLLAYLLTKIGYRNIWPLFGSANQLLSVLALVACAVYMKKTSRKGWMLWAPMVVMLCVTFTALTQKMVALISAPTAGNILQLAFAAALFVLGMIVVVLGFRRLAADKAVRRTPSRAEGSDR
ncbi:MAG: carbon starvation protein A [Oscillospiraceae bacterium]|nr:carbon starvation protein A [Oscillospiraceae bacterium]